MRWLAGLTLAAGVFATATALPAKESKKGEQPAIFRELADCRATADREARLACYDRRVDVFVAAAEKGDILVADRKQLQEARRGLFGFAAPLGKLLGFGGGDDAAEEIKRIETTVASARQIESGWRLAFAEGGVWEQIDVKNFVMSPRVGQKARISKAALGSYFVSVNGQPGIKMRRVE